jgi:hypothetical protein
MKGQPELLVERAVLQARREADLLYNLVVIANVKVIEGELQRERECIFLLRYLIAEMRAKATKDRVQTLRLTVLMFLESVIILDAAIAQVAKKCEFRKRNGERCGADAQTGKEERVRRMPLN